MTQERDDEIPRRRFFETRDRAHAVVSEYTGKGLECMASERLKPVMGRACLDYYRTLRKHRSEKAVKDEWPEIEEAIQPIIEARGEATKVKTEAVGRTSAAETTHRPAIHQIPFDYMEEIIVRLDDLAKELGLSEQVEQGRDRYGYIEPEEEHGDAPEVATDAD